MEYSIDIVIRSYEFKSSLNSPVEMAQRTAQYTVGIIIFLAKQMFKPITQWNTTKIK